MFMFAVENIIEKTKNDLERKIEIAVTIRMDERFPEVVFEKIRNMDGIRRIQFISKEETYIKAKADEEFSKFLSLLDKNPFPHTITLSIQNPFESDLFLERISKISGVEKVLMDRKAFDWYRLTLNYLKFLRVAMYILFFCVFIIVVFFVYQILVYKMLMTFGVIGMTVVGVLCSILAFLLFSEFLRILIHLHNILIAAFTGAILGGLIGISRNEKSTTYFVN